MSRLVVCLLLLAAAVSGDRHDKYEGHQLYRVAGAPEEIANLEAHLDILSATPASRSTSGKLEALVRLSPKEKAEWLQNFDRKGMTYTKIADNLATILRDEEHKINLAREQRRDGEPEPAIWEDFQRHETVNNYLDELAAQYPQKVTVINAGVTYEGRQIKYIRISTSRFEDLHRPLVVIDAAMHAREWVTTPVALYIINQLVVDLVDSELTDRMDWIIIPVANPDGYEYSIDEDRLWRKTRTVYPDSNVCQGVDGNRNFDHYWGTNPTTADNCANVFEGPQPFSEPEARVVRDAVSLQIHRTAMYISLHSYGSMFLYSWGHNGSLPVNGLSLHLAGVRMAQAIDDVALEEADDYVVGNAAQVLYTTTGTSRDWARASGVPMTYTLELPGYEYGFVVPPEYLPQIVTETWAGIRWGAYYVLSIYG